MELFKPKRDELKLLCKYVHELRLLNLTDNRQIAIPLSGAMAGGSRRKLFLEGDFAIGDVAFADPSLDDAIPFLSDMIVGQYERAWISHMMTCLNLPISLQLSSERYYSEIAKQLGNASFGRTVILRLFEEREDKLNRDLLICSAIYDRSGYRLDAGAFNIEKDHSPAFNFYNDFAERFLSDPTQVMLLHADVSPGLFAIGKQLLKNNDIKTLVVTALSIGGTISGFATIAYESRIELPRDLLLAFANMTNHASAAIENFRKLETLHSLRNQQLREYIENLQYDLIQGFRHAARNALFAAKGHARALHPHYNYKGARPEEDPYKKLNRNLDEIDHALNNMASLKLVDENKEISDISELFDRACDLMKFQLDEANVTVKKTTKGRLVLPLNRLSVIYAFSNLILNSIQAFEDHRKGDRQITLTGSRTGRDIVIDFSDNGPGIRLGSGDIQTYDDIWVPGKTSKRKGTGYGLPMVREVFQRLHNGSVNLRPSGRGVLFRINLRTDVE